MIALARECPFLHLSPMPASPARTHPRCRTTRTFTARAEAVTDRIATGRAIYARKFGMNEAEAEKASPGPELPVM